MGPNNEDNENSVVEHDGGTVGGSAAGGRNKQSFGSLTAAATTMTTTISESHEAIRQTHIDGDGPSLPLPDKRPADDDHNGRSAATIGGHLLGQIIGGPEQQSARLEPDSGRELCSLASKRSSEASTATGVSSSSRTSSPVNYSAYSNEPIANSVAAAAASSGIAVHPAGYGQQQQQQLMSSSPVSHRHNPDAGRKCPDSLDDCCGCCCEQDPPTATDELPPAAPAPSSAELASRRADNSSAELISEKNNVNVNNNNNNSISINVKCHQVVIVQHREGGCASAALAASEPLVAPPGGQSKPSNSDRLVSEWRRVVGQRAGRLMELLLGILRLVGRQDKQRAAAAAYGANDSCAKDLLVTERGESKLVSKCTNCGCYSYYNYDNKSNNNNETAKTAQSLQNRSVQSQAAAAAAAPPPPVEPVNKQQPKLSPQFQQQQQLKEQAAEGLESKRERKAAKTLAIITGVFVMCWLPFFVMAITMPLLNVSPPKYVFNVLLWLGYVNSMLNPIIYTIFSPDFRKAFKRLLCALDTGGQETSARRGQRLNQQIASQRQAARYDTSVRQGSRRGCLAGLCDRLRGGYMVQLGQVCSSSSSTS